MGSIYFAPLRMLLRADAAAGDIAACTRTRDQMLTWLPPARLGLDSAQTRGVIEACNATAKAQGPRPQ
jgi:hypothetical protein